MTIQSYTRYHRTDPSVAYAAGVPNFGDTGANGFDAGGTMLATRNDANSDSTIGDLSTLGGTIAAINGKGWILGATSTAGLGSAFFDLTNYDLHDIIPFGSTVQSIRIAPTVVRFTGSNADTWRFGLRSATQTTPGAFQSFINGPGTSAAWQSPTLAELTAATSGITAWVNAGVIPLFDIFDPGFGARFFVRTTHPTDPSPQMDALGLVITVDEPATYAPTGFFYKLENVLEGFRGTLNGQGVWIADGDSNLGFAGKGHRTAIERGAMLAGFTMRATGLAPMAFYEGQYIGFNYSSSGSVDCAARDVNRIVANNDYGPLYFLSPASLTHPAGVPTIIATGHFAGRTFSPNERAYIRGYGATTGVTKGFYEIASQPDNNTITLATSPSAGVDKPSGIILCDIVGTDPNEGVLANIGPSCIGYVNDAGSIAAGGHTGMTVGVKIGPGDSVDATKRIAYRVFYVSGTSGAGSFTLQARHNGTAAVTNGVAVNTVEAMAAVRVATLVLDPDPTRTSVSFGLVVPNGTIPVQGPLFVMFQQAYNPDEPNGFSLNVVHQQGGESGWDFQAAYTTLGSNRFTNIASAMRGTGGLSDSTPRVWVCIDETGGNDRNEANPSIGNIYPGCGGATRNAYADNLSARLQHKTDTITGQFPDDRVYHLCVVTHPHYAIPAGTTEDAQVASYRQAACWVADQRTDTAVAWLPNVASVAEYQAGYNPGDNAHILEALTNLIWERIFEKIIVAIGGSGALGRREQVRLARRAA